KLIGDMKPFIVCLQETKMGVCDDFFCASLWSGSSHAYSYRPSVGVSGGLLVMWDTGEVETMQSRCCGNLYQENYNKWKERKYVCVGTSMRSGVMKRDVLLAMVFGPLIMTAKLRGLSDHCPLLLSVDEENWGPRPVRMLKCWHDISGFRQFVIDKWNSLQLDGWGGFVLKEKLKLIKLALKEWHGSHARNLPGRLDDLKNRLSVLDSKGEEEELTEEELADFRSITSDIHSLSRVNASISWQQSRLIWLREGDANSKYFHLVLASRCRQNALSVIMVDGERVEGVQPVRQAVFTHFSAHF
ncbi:hypothetical protein TSUD_40160, partial [Trifolium subterraneum]